MTTIKISMVIVLLWIAQFQHWQYVDSSSVQHNLKCQSESWSYSYSTIQADRMTYELRHNFHYELQDCTLEKR